MSSSTSGSERRRGGAAVALTALLVAGAWVLGVERSAVDTIHRVSPFRYQLLRLEDAGAQTRVLALGDSHAGMGFRSPDRRIQSVAWAGESVEQNRLRYAHLAPYLPRLRAVALQLQPHSLLSGRDYDPDEVRHAAYRQLLDGSPDFHPFERRLHQFDPCCRPEMPAFALRRWLGLPLPAVDPRVSDTGFLRFPNASPLEVEAAAAEEVAGMESFEVVDRLAQQFDAFITALTDAGLEVVIVRFPLSEPYRRMIPTLLAAADEVGRALAARPGVHPCGSWDAGLPVSAFFNADHLTEEGARTFWDQLAPCFEAYLD